MADSQTSPHSSAPLVIQRVQPYERRGIALTCEAIGADGRIAEPYSAYHDEIVPGLSWSAVLEAQTYALVVEDPDAPGDRPFLHWLMWNIPGQAIGLPAGLPRLARPPQLAGAVQGLNGAGGVGWHGPKPPPGHGLHRYHFQLFALGGRLDHLEPDAGLETLVSALKGLTLAAADLVGTYQRLDGAQAPAERPFISADENARGGLDADDLDRHAPHTPSGEVLRGA